MLHSIIMYLLQENMMADIIQQRYILIQLMSTNDEIYLAADFTYHQWIQENTPLISIKKASE